MIIFLADGRLGNQIFQYTFLKTIQKNNEKIIVSGFEELKEVFEINDIVYLNKKNKWLRTFLNRIIKPILYYLSQIKIISSIAINHETILEKYRREITTFNNIKGLFKNITFVKLGFFQSESFFKKEIADNLKIKDIYIQEASNFLNSLSKNSHKIFIHIRRGDYNDFKVYGKNTLLPMNYFHNQIKWFLNNRQNCDFIFLSDEPDFIEKEFDYLKDKIISKNNHFGTDLAIMTLCNSAILSPSSFGWWGSYLMKDRDIVFAPKYWLGFESKVEYHKNSIASFMEEMEI